MGITNAAPMFQRNMETILSGLFVIAQNGIRNSNKVCYSNTGYCIPYIGFIN